MRLVFLSAIILLAGYAKLSAQQPAASSPVVTNSNPNAAEIIFDADEHDFGTLKQGSECVFEFKFKNAGKEPLVISNAQPSCGCTVPQWPKEPVKPGELSVIKVKYDSNRVGPFEKTITVTSNAKTQQKVIRIKGKIEAKPVEEQFPSNGVSKSGIPFEGR